MKNFFAPRWTSRSLPVPCHRRHTPCYKRCSPAKDQKRPSERPKAYGTRCSQAVPHPSTILARRCLTSVIRRERVCSSWYGRRRQLVKSACSHSTLAQIGYVHGHTCSRMPQVQKNHIPGRPSKAIFNLQIKNIKLHIVTDIKVTFNSMLGFRISIFGWGVGNFTHQIKS